MFGPAEDGGFWLVGARRAPRLPPLFGHGALVRARMRSPTRSPGCRAGVSVGFAARLEDVDDGEAYRRLVPRRGF